jgi:hypothetical protein
LAQVILGIFDDIPAKNTVYTPYVYMALANPTTIKQVMRFETDETALKAMLLLICAMLLI